MSNEFDMIEILAKLCNTKKVSNENFIAVVFSVLCTFNKIENLNIKIDNNIMCTACYDYIKPEISINLNNINNKIEQYNTYFNNNKLLQKLIIIQTLCHEIKHALQNIDIKSTKNNLEMKIIKTLKKEETILSTPYLRYYYENLGILKEISKKEKYYYHKLYDVDPLERDAEIYSLDIIVRILNKMNINKHIYDFFYDKLIIEKTKDYAFMTIFYKQIQLFPINSYIKNKYIEDDFNKLKNDKEYEKISSEFKMNLGLPLTKEEYDNELNKLKLLKKGRN